MPHSSESRDWWLQAFSTTKVCWYSCARNSYRCRYNTVHQHVLLLLGFMLLRPWEDTDSNHLQKAVITEDLILFLWLASALLEAAVVCMCRQKRLCSSPFQARSMGWFKELMKVASANSSTFVQSVRECLLLAQLSGGNFELLMDRCCEAEHLQPSQPEGLGEGVCHWPQEMGQLIWQTSSSCWPCW